MGHYHNSKCYSSTTTEYRPKRSSTCVCRVLFVRRKLLLSSPDLETFISVALGINCIGNEYNTGTASTHCAKCDRVEIKAA